jgi:hypothetical protein
MADEYPVRARASQQIHGVKADAARRIVAYVQRNTARIRQLARNYNPDRVAAMPERNRNQSCHCDQQQRQRYANT